MAEHLLQAIDGRSRGDQLRPLPPVQRAGGAHAREALIDDGQDARDLAERLHDQRAIRAGVTQWIVSVARNWPSTRPRARSMSTVRISSLISKAAAAISAASSFVMSATPSKLRCQSVVSARKHSVAPRRSSHSTKYL